MKRAVSCFALLLLLANVAGAAPRIWREALTGMPFVALPKGCFKMGSNKPVMPVEALALKHLTYKGTLSADETPQHEVCVDAFLIGQFEVRADDWLKVMGEHPPEGRGQAPASGISWEAAQDFARRLTQQSAGQYRFRLPSEAEWEYACRAGQTKEIVPYGDEHVAIAWYSVHGHFHSQPSEAGKLKANAWGLHDMLGNVWEWVEDAYRVDAYAKHQLYNPATRGDAKTQRVIRGASFRSEYLQVRCATRSSYAADDALGHIGLRLVRTP